MSFKKFDNGKSRPDLITGSFIMGVGRVMAHGAIKYGLDNWKECKEKWRYKAALMRHTVQYVCFGERFDPDSGESHLYHIGCNCSFLDYFDNLEDIAENPDEDFTEIAHTSHLRSE